MSDRTLSVAIETHDDISWVRLDGEICDDAITEAREAVIDIIENQAQRVLIDLSGVHYISSSGIGMLVTLLKRCHQAEIPFAVTGLRDEIRELFALTRLDQVFTVVQSLEAWQASTH